MIKLILRFSGQKDGIPGGLAKGKQVSDFDPVALKKGIEVELEHTSDIDIATEIAMDHLTEDPQYYEKLSTIEKNNNLVQENKHSIIKLRYPEVLANILVDKFGKNAYLIAKWNLQYLSEYVKRSQSNKMKWWMLAYREFLSTKIDLSGFIRLYEALISRDEDKFNKTAEQYNFTRYENFDDKEDLEQALKDEIESLFLTTSFFYSELPQAILAGAVPDLNPYKDMDFADAAEKYSNKKLQTKPIISYDSGYKWVDLGKKCEIIGKQMKNCGSAGSMSSDPNASIVVLLDINNKPNVITTYSPNQNKFSSVEGVASTEPKDKYHKYVLDLIKILNAKLDHINNKSDTLYLKYLLRNFGDISVEELPVKKYAQKIFYVVISGDDYITDGTEFVEKPVFDKLTQQNNIENEQINKQFKLVKQILDNSKEFNKYIKDLQLLRTIYNINEGRDMKLKIKNNIVKEGMDMSELDSTPPPDFSGEPDYEGGMARSQLLKVAQYSQELLAMIDDGMQLPSWVQSKITKLADYIGAVKHFMEGELTLDEKKVKNPGKYKTGMKVGYDKDGDGIPNGADSDPLDGSVQEIVKKKINVNESYIVEGSCEETGELFEMELYYEECGCGVLQEQQLEEAEYQGRKVTLNKPMRGDVKKFKVYVKDPSTGNVKKVNFGDPNMRIKKSNPARRKSFRARHNCDNPGPKTKARYWSCRKW